MFWNRSITPIAAPSGWESADVRYATDQRVQLKELGIVVRIDITGDRYGRLIAVRRVYSSSVSRWLCRCKCGKCVAVRLSDLRTRKTRSCGCMRSENTKRNNRLRSTHGETRNGKIPPEYLSWRAAKARCFNPNNAQYSSYGGRGITMCRRWRESFKNFVTDMGRRPSLKYSIERIDGSGNYEPGNCKWATSREQTRNRSCTRFYSYRGKTQTIREWSEELGVDFWALAWRYKQGWDAEIALTTPFRKLRK